MIEALGKEVLDDQPGRGRPAGALSAHEPRDLVVADRRDLGLGEALRVTHAHQEEREEQAIGGDVRDRVPQPRIVDERSKALAKGVLVELDHRRVLRAVGGFQSGCMTHQMLGINKVSR